MSLLRAWAAHRPVVRTAAAVLVAIVAGVAATGWRIVADDSTVAVAQLAHGPRHLVGPLVLLAVVAAALAGSVASSDAASGHAAVLATSFGSVRRGGLALVALGSAGAAAFVLALGTVLALAAIGMVHQVGGGGPVAVGAVLDVATLVARAAAVAGGLGALAAAAGLALPGRSLPAMASSIGVLAVEAAAIPLSGGRLDLVGSSLGIAVVGTAQAVRLGHEPGLAAAVTLLVVVVGPAAAALVALAVARLRPLPS